LGQLRQKSRPGPINMDPGSSAVIRSSLAALALALGSLSVCARVFSPQAAIVPVLLGIALWGAAAWGFYPGQQSRLVTITGLQHASVVLSLNAAVMYLGFSIGTSFGALVVAHGSVKYLGLIGAVCETAALALFASITPGTPANVVYGSSAGSAHRTRSCRLLGTEAPASSRPIECASATPEDR
jgi:hypothetical protein